MKLGKYVDECVNALQAKASEERVILHIKNVHESGQYIDLEKRVIYDVCRACYKIWQHVPTITDITNNHLSTLYYKSFKKAFPKAWDYLQVIK